MRQYTLSLAEAAPAFPFLGQCVAGDTGSMHQPVVLEGLAEVELLTRLLSRLCDAGAAAAILAVFGNLAAVTRASRAEFVARTHLDGHIHDQILLGVEVGARVAKAALDRIPLNSYGLVVDYLHARIGHLAHEQFRVLFLDTRNCLIEDQLMNNGTHNFCPVFPREIMRRAMELQANALILSHNHPSGDCTPSEGDIKMTRKVAAAAKALGIVIHDHIIVGHGQSASFRTKGLI